MEVQKHGYKKEAETYLISTLRGQTFMSFTRKTCEVEKNRLKLWMEVDA